MLGSLLLVLLGSSSFLHADQNQSAFSDSNAFVLDTYGPDPMEKIPGANKHNNNTYFPGTSDRPPLVAFML